MSFFPTADPEKLRAAMAQQYAYYQVPATPSPSSHAQQPHHGIHDEQRLHHGWPVVTSAQDVYSASQTTVWPAQGTHGLGLDMMATPTQSFFDAQYPTPTSSHTPSVWGTTHGMGLPASSFPAFASQQPAMENCYSLAGSLPVTSSWDAPGSSFIPVYDSPGRSDYSTSSRQSLVESSPYAHSDGCYQMHSPPYIKVEEAAESHRPRLYSVPGALPLDRPSHVNPGDVYTSPPPSAVDQAHHRPSNAPPKFEDDEDAKPYVSSQRSRTPSAVSEDSDTSTVEHRPKRGYTTHANSTCHCDKCGRLFQRSYNLKAHMDTHDPHREQPHACYYAGCKRRFVRRTDLIRHERSVHLKERLFSCPLCRSAFARKDTLRRHIDDGCPRRPGARKTAETVQDAADLPPRPHASTSPSSSSPSSSSSSSSSSSRRPHHGSLTKQEELP